MIIKNDAAKRTLVGMAPGTVLSSPRRQRGPAVVPPCRAQRPSAPSWAGVASAGRPPAASRLGEPLRVLARPAAAAMTATGIGFRARPYRRFRPATPKAGLDMDWDDEDEATHVFDKPRLTQSKPPGRARPSAGRGDAAGPPAAPPLGAGVEVTLLGMASPFTRPAASPAPRVSAPPPPPPPFPVAERIRADLVRGPAASVFPGPAAPLRGGTDCLPRPRIRAPRPRWLASEHGTDADARAPLRRALTDTPKAGAPSGELHVVAPPYAPNRMEVTQLVRPPTSRVGFVATVAVVGRRRGRARDHGDAAHRPHRCQCDRREGGRGQPGRDLRGRQEAVRHRSLHRRSGSSGGARGESSRRRVRRAARQGRHGRGAQGRAARLCAQLGVEREGRDGASRSPEASRA